LKRLGVVVGLPAEARVLRRNWPDQTTKLTIAFGPAGALELTSAGVEALLSFGLAGALDPKLRPGALVVADQVITDQGPPLPCDPRWTARLLSLSGGSKGPVLGQSEAAPEAATKRRLHEEFSALTIDMESHAVAQAAQQAGLPFAVLRAVVDEAGGDLPRTALAAIESGEYRPWRSLTALAQHPGELPALLRLALDQRKALSTLGSVVRAGLGLDAPA
jgi:adenosylhomocysteine nucleosidase